MSQQAPELSPMDDQLWRELKRLIAANRHAASIDALAADVADWILTLTPQQARREAGIASKQFWLGNLLQLPGPFQQPRRGAGVLFHLRPAAKISPKGLRARYRCIPISFLRCPLGALDKTIHKPQYGPCRRRDAGRTW